MNVDVALKIFALGMRFGHEQTKLGLEIGEQSDERLASILNAGFVKYQSEIELHAKVLNAEKERRSWYNENWTARNSYRFGLIDGHACKDKILTEEKMKELTNKLFDQCRGFSE